MTRARWTLGGLTQRALAGSAGIAAALLVLEIAMRVVIAFDPAPTSELRKTEQYTAPAPSGDCKQAGAAQATLAHIVRPSFLPGIVYELKPSALACYRGARHLTNRDGQRARSFEPYARPKPQGTFRVLLLGDSWAYGQSVDHEESFGAQLERLLATRHTGAHVEVINSGVPGYNTAQEAAYLLERGMSYEPDCVMVLFVANDLGLPFLMLEPRNPLSLGRSYLFERLASLVPSGAPPPIPPGMTDVPGPLGNFVGADELDRVPAQYRYMVGVSGYKRALEAIAVSANRVPIVNIASYTDVVSFGPREQQEVVEFQAKLGIHHVFVPVFRDKTFWVAPDDRHPNGRGYAKMAGLVLEFLEAHGLCLPERSGR
jgi:lysophospholipase L1-like esterase